MVVHGCGGERSDAALRDYVRHGLSGAPRYLVIIRDRAIIVVHWLLRKPEVVSLVLLACFFFPLLWLSQYNYPSGDDYFQFFQAHTLGTLGATRWWYRHWTGRYTSFFLQSLFPGYDAWLAAYKITPVALFLTGFACSFAFMRAFFGPSFSTRVIFTLTSCTYIFLVGLTPDIAEGFYWLAANMQYMGAVFVTLLLLALYIKLGRTTEPLARGLVLGSILILIAFLAGLNEISLLLFASTLAAIGYFSFRKSGRIPTQALMCLAVAFLFGLLAFLAPGNLFRVGQVAKADHSVHAYVNALLVAPSILLELVSSTPLLPASVLYLAFLEANRDRVGHLASMLSGVRSHWILLLLMGTLTVITVITHAATGAPTLSARVENVYVYSIVLTWVAILTALFVNLMSTSVRFSLERWATGVLTVAVALGVVTGSDLRMSRSTGISSSSRIELASIQAKGVYASAYLDLLSERAARYSRQAREATARFRAANGECVDFPALASDVPRTLFIRVKYPWTFCPKRILERWMSAAS